MILYYKTYYNFMNRLYKFFMQKGLLWFWH